MPDEGRSKDAPIKDWVKLAVSRARATGAPAVFWLDEKRPHDKNLIAKVNAYLRFACNANSSRRTPTSASAAQRRLSA